MPDVIIKGMEMPSRCEDCFAYMHNAEYDYAYCNISSTNVLGHGNARLNNCPLRPAPEWIKFTTREPDAEEREMHPDWEYVLNCQLPDDGQRILVLVKYSAHEKVQMDEFCYDTDGCYLDSGYDLVSEVTHWMPLPEPPKGGDGDG